MKNWLALALALLLAIAPAAAKPRKNMPIPLGAGGTPTWVVNPGNPPDFMLDFTGNRAWVKNPPAVTSPAALISTSRASPGYVNDSNGTWTLVPADTARISNLGLLVEEGRTNSIRNNSMQGAIVQADSVELLTNGNFAAAGTGWTSNTSGGTVVFSTGLVAITGTGSGLGNNITQQISGLTVGRNYVFVITTNNSTGMNLSVGNSPADTTVVNGAAVVSNGFASTSADRVGFTATATSHWITVSKVQASTANLINVSVQDGERAQNVGFTSSPLNATPNIIQNGWTWSVSASSTVTYGSNQVTLTSDGTGAAANLFQNTAVSTPTVSGCTYTLSVTAPSGAGTLLVRVGTSAAGTQLLNTSMTSGQTKLFQFTATSATSYIGFINVTPSTSVVVSNVSVVSAGKLPTNWFASVGTTALVSQVSGIGTEGGVDYIDLRAVGTSAASSTYTVGFESSSAVAAATGQTWTGSLFAKLQAGTLTGISTPTITMSENTSGGTFVAGANTNVGVPDGTALGLQRQSVVRLFTGGGTVGAAQHAYRVPVANAAVVDVTFRIGWPQLELGASVTSPIRTTAGAAVRNYDLVLLTSPPAFGAAYSFYAKGTPQAPISFIAPQFAIQVDDGTATNRVFLRRELGTGNSTWRSVGGTTWNITGTPVVTQGASFKLAGAAATSDEAGYSNASQIGTASAATLPPGIVAVRIGSDSTGTNQWNGFIESAAMWATQRLPNAQMQGMTTP